MNKAVFFDRDDTLIEDRVYLNDPDDIHYLDGVFDALKLVHNAGFKIIVVTNQSGVAKGIVDTKNIHEIHRRINTEFAKHDIPILDFPPRTPSEARAAALAILSVLPSASSTFPIILTPPSSSLSSW